MKKESIGFIVILIVQVLLVAGLIFYMEKCPLEEYQYEGSEMVYIDVHTSQGNYRKICSPQTPLGVGSYEYEMVYRATESGMDMTFTNCGSETFSIKGNSELFLYEGVHELVADFRLSLNLEGFSAIIYCPEDEEFYVESVCIRETNDTFRNLLISIILVFSVVDSMWFLDTKKNREWLKEHKIALITMTVSIFLASLPLMLHYLTTGHDLEFHLLRIDGIATALQNGDFPVRMHSNYMDGYGYPTGIFYPELFLYFPAILHLLGIPLMGAYKCFLLLENILTVCFAFYGAKVIFKSERYASVFCILYTLLPYRMVNEYYRAAVGESLAMMFLPLLLAAMYLLLSKKPTRAELQRAVILLTISVTGVLQSHILSCEIYGIFGLLTVLLCAKRFFRTQVLFAVGKSVLWVLLLNVWFLLPFFAAFGLDVNVRQESVGNIGVQGLNLWQLFAFTPEASGNSKSITEGIANEMPLYLGWATVICLVLAVVFIEKLWKEKEEDIKGMAVICTITGCLALWMTTYLFPWTMIAYIPKVNLILQTVQFPWRYLSVAGGVLLFAGLVVVRTWTKESYRRNVLVLLIGLSVFITLSFCQSMTEHKPYYVVYDGAGLDSYSIMGKEYLYAGTDVEDLKLHTEYAYPVQRENGELICEIDTNISVEGAYELPLLYYPWYEAKDIQTGERLTLVKGNNNIAVLEMPEGYSGTVSVGFSEPLLWKICTAVSALSGILFMICVVSLRNKKCLFGKEKKSQNTE